MINIRQNIFETNSSSTHSICIAKKKNYEIPETFYFKIGEFGWEERFIYDSTELGSYLYTSIVCTNYYPLENFKNYVYEVLGKYGCECTFEKPVYNERWHFLEDGYVDHAGELGEFLEAVMHSESKLLKFLFSPDSFIITGNDNSDWYFDIVEDVDFSKVEKYYKGN